MKKARVLVSLAALAFSVISGIVTPGYHTLQQQTLKFITLERSMATRNKKFKIVPPSSEQIEATRDEILRAEILEAIKVHLQERDLVSDKEFQRNLSRVLCWVECTDTGNAIRFAARYGHLFHYVPEPAKWYMWDGRQWSEDTSFQIMAYAKKTAAHVELEKEFIPMPADKDGDPLVRPARAPLDASPWTKEENAILAQFAKYDSQVKRLEGWSLQSRAKQKLQAMIELLKDEPDITVEKARFDANDYLLNCKNGVADLKNGIFMRHSPAFLMTRMINSDLSPVAECEEWKSFIAKVMSHKVGDTVERRPGLEVFLQKIAGMGLCGERFDDIFVVFHGAGSNGKTVFQEVLRDMMGSYADIAPSEMFLEKKSDAGYFEMAGLDGIRFLFKDETKQGRRLDEATVKEMTGGSPKKACFKFKDFFGYMPKFTPILSTNHKPVITGDDNGIWRRVKLVPWEHNFETDPEKRGKPEVLAKLRKEYAGILMWAYMGLRCVLADLEQYGAVTIPDEVKAATEGYREQSDVIGTFIAEYCKIEAWARVPLSVLYAKYQAFMEEAGMKPFNKINFGEQILNRGYEKTRGTGGTSMWSGLRLREIGEFEPDPDEPQQEETSAKREKGTID